MAWLESHQSLLQHPKTKRLSRLLGVSQVTAIGHLHVLWWWSLDYAQDGSLAKYHPDEIADAAMWEGDPELFVSALLDSGFVDEEGLELHDWLDYAGKLVDQKQKNAERMREARAKRKKERAPHVHRTDEERALHVQGLPKQPNQPTRPDQTPCTHAHECEAPDAPDQDELSSSSSQDYAEVAQIYQAEFGQATPLIAEELGYLLEEYGIVWLRAAFKESVERGRRNLAFLKGILANWKAEGGIRNSTRAQVGVTASRAGPTTGWAPTYQDLSQDPEVIEFKRVREESNHDARGDTGS